METTFSKDRSIPVNYIALFDLDQTITKSISGNALARGAYRKGLLKNRDLLNAVFLSILFRLKLIDARKIIDRMVSWVEGISENTMTELCYEVFHQVLLPSVYKEARAEIAWHKTNYARVVLLSSALSAICQEMATDLGIDDIICSELEVKDGYLTGKPLGHLCFGDEKAVRLLAYCDNNMYSLSDAWYYGDSISDLTALKAVGNPVCINPDKKLKKEAVKRAWKILYWRG